MNSTIDKRVINMLVNDDFINYVLNPNLILKEMWDDFFGSNPEMIPVANEAKMILLGEAESNKLASFEVWDLENSIFEQCGLSLAN